MMVIVACKFRNVVLPVRRQLPTSQRTPPPAFLTSPANPNVQWNIEAEHSAVIMLRLHSSMCPVHGVATNSSCEQLWGGQAHGLGLRARAEISVQEQLAPQ